MTRSIPTHYLPHGLLLTGAALGLSVSLNTAPTDTPQAPQVIQAPAQVDHADEYGLAYMHAEGNTRSLGEVLRQVRARMNAIYRSQEASAEEQATAQAPLASLIETPQQRRMIRRQDVQALPKVKPAGLTRGAEYVVSADPLLWQVPDAIEPLEYVVLEYGQVGQESVEAHTAASETLTVTDPTPSAPSAGAFSSDAEATTELVTTAPAPAPAVSPLPPTVTSSTPDTPVSIITRQTASLTTPTPVANHAEPMPVDQSDTRAQERPTQSPTLIEHKPTPTAAFTPQAFARQTQPTTQQTPARETINPTGTPDRGWTEKSPNLSSAKTKADTPTPTVTLAQPVAPTPERKNTTPAVVTKSASATPTHDAPKAPKTKTSTPAIKTPDTQTKPLIVYVDGHDTIGSDRVNAIDNALSRINDAVKQADLDVQLKITTDKSTGYNIHFSENDGKGMGNKLGLAEFAVTQNDQGQEFFLGENSQTPGGQAKVSINNAFDWYAGDDADDIDDNEYDYQTAVAHEFLHLLGLDDDFDNPNAVSHGLLNPGTARRDLDSHDLVELTDIYHSYNPWESYFNPSSWSKHFSNGWGNGWGKTRYHAKALTAVVAPEPASLALIGLGMLGIARVRRR